MMLHQVSVMDAASLGHAKMQRCSEQTALVRQDTRLAQHELESVLKSIVHYSCIPDGAGNA